MREEWMAEKPCLECCRKADDPDQSLCRLYAYDIDCVYMARYEGQREGQRTLLEYLINQYKSGFHYPSLLEYNTMLKQLEKEK